MSSPGAVGYAAVAITILLGSFLSIMINVNSLQYSGLAYGGVLAAQSHVSAKTRQGWSFLTNHDDKKKRDEHARTKSKGPRRKQQQRPHQLQTPVAARFLSVGLTPVAGTSSNAQSNDSQLKRDEIGSKIPKAQRRCGR